MLRKYVTVSKIRILTPSFLKISAIIKDPHLIFSLLVLIVSREGKVSQFCYLGPSFYFMKYYCCGKE